MEEKEEGKRWGRSELNDEWKGRTDGRRLQYRAIYKTCTCVGSNSGWSRKRRTDMMMRAGGRKESLPTSPDRTRLRP